MRTSSVFSGLIPWLFIPFFTVFKLVARPTANFAEAPFSELSPLLWELSGLVIAVAIMTAGKLLSTMASHPVVLSFIAVATYTMIPAASLWSRSVADPTQSLRGVLGLYPETLALTMSAALLSIALMAPLAPAKAAIHALAVQKNRLSSMRTESSSRRRAGQEDIAKQLDAIVLPAVQRVILLLKSASPSAESISGLTADIHHSISKVIKPFSHRLIADTSFALKSPRLLYSDDPTTFSWNNLVSLRYTVLPAQYALLVGGLLAATIARDASPQNPLTLDLVTFAGAITLALWAALAIVRVSIPRSWKLHPGIGLVFLAPAGAVFCEFLVEALRRIPPDFLGYGTWGLVSNFPNSVIGAAIAGPTLAIVGAINARRKEILEQTATYQREIEDELATLKTEIWHLRRQAGLMVNGPLQGALIATGLRLQQSGASEDEVSRLVAKLESALARIHTGAMTDQIHAFFASLANAWDGVCGLSWLLDEGASQVLSDQPATSSAVAEVVSEGLNNAVVHGQAQNVDISIVLSSRYTVEVSMTDDGNGPLAEPGVGLGSQRLNTIAQSWSLERKNGRTLLSVAIANPPWH